MQSHSHIFHYKGYVIIYDNGLYHLQLNPAKKFISAPDIFHEIDKIEVDFEKLQEKLMQKIKDQDGCI